ncbi:hypothetical protein EB796_022548 [Bugula neritina]|uniref:AMP-dependent synthetase/ligase domain-containing protein n=1 Tax=Bugula neritina TaxID=10212 RepID=A0A7J7J0D1_BUGNE|nr:hypothetical protein EB796_022548 [Bugula neritina]
MIKLIDVPEKNFFAVENVGEVCCKGVNVFSGYLRNEEKTRESLIMMDGYILEILVDGLSYNLHFSFYFDLDTNHFLNKIQVVSNDLVDQMLLSLLVDIHHHNKLWLVLQKRKSTDAVLQTVRVQIIYIVFPKIWS